MAESKGAFLYNLLEPGMGYLNGVAKVMVVTKTKSLTSEAQGFTMKWTRDLVFCAFFFHAVSVRAINPGFKGKITTKGINYGCQIITSVLQNRLLNMKIPDISGIKYTNALHQLQYNINRITISNVNLPDMSIILVPNLGLKVAMSNGYIETNGNWQIKANIFRTHGTVKAQINSIAISFYLKFGKDNSGHPTVSMMDCASYISKLQVYVSGKASWLYNLIIRWYEPTLRRYLSDKICLELQKIFAEKIGPFLQTVPVTKEIDKYVGIDYSLTSLPEVAKDSLILPLKVKKIYPVMKMELHLVTDSAPTVAFLYSKIILTTSGDVYAFAILPNSTLAPLFSVKLNAQITTTIGIKDDKITGQLTLDRIQLSLKKSNIGPFQVNCLQTAIDFLVSIVILPRINAALADGYPLPLIDHFKLSNLIVQPHENFLLVATDFTYI
ncbi:lipopolysaccharide-binding protein-like [Rhincodon typus]|uniref:lipopolysaccharide-binding protein-like n=1 Tax=Rhincodon typus TaxID=259920 RepID=UPI00202FDF7D|nr:lipopolysaccharide-binding protein-like [Rhincodon typus]